MLMCLSYLDNAGTIHTVNKKTLLVNVFDRHRTGARAVPLFLRDKPYI